MLASDLVKMKIDLTDKTPFKIKPYRLSLNDQKVVDKAVREWESQVLFVDLEVLTVQVLWW